MKKIFQTLLFIPIISLGQTYSRYYGTVDVNANVNINKNVDVSGNVNVNKTITTIDYGALRLANAEREKIRLQKQIYDDEKKKSEAIEIALDPSKAIYYGEKTNFRKFWWTIPHPSLFNKVNPFDFENYSDNGVVTKIELNSNKIKGIAGNQNLEAFIKSAIDKLEVGKTNEIFNEYFGYYKNPKGFIHKIDLNKANVYGSDGFKLTIIYEDDYEYIIEDRYYRKYRNKANLAKVKFSGDKDEITFEDLEGRRYYFKKLINQLISTVSAY